MPYEVKLLPIVRTDLQQAKAWYYNKGGASLAEEFKNEVNKEIDYISEFPEHYQPKYKGLRQSLVNRFPYVIFYRIEKESILVIGVLHGRRNPATIHKRRK